MQCISCSTDHQYDFCPNCGESSKTPKITFATITSAGLSTISNMDKGFLYNLKQLTIAPQKLILDYLGGKRKNILNPISYLIISITIFLLVTGMFDPGWSPRKLKSETFNIAYEAGRFIGKYFKFFWISSIIWLSLSTCLVFKKYTLAEHMAINAFVLGHATLICTVAESIFTLTLLFNPLVYITIAYLTYKVHKRKSKDTDMRLMSISTTMIFFFFLIFITVCISFFLYQFA